PGCRRLVELRSEQRAPACRRRVRDRRSPGERRVGGIREANLVVGGRDRAQPDCRSRGVTRRDRPRVVARDPLVPRPRRASPVVRRRPALTIVGGIRRRVILGLVASVVALGGVLAPATAPIARAAADGLDLRTAATYTIVPNRHVVRVVLDITARNNKPSVTSGGIVTRYFYEGARVAIQSAAKNIHATSNGAALTTTTTPSGGYSILEIRFRNSLFFQQTA